MIIKVNDEEIEIASGSTISDLVKQLGYEEKEGFAIARNNKIAIRSKWKEIKLEENDNILIITAVRGG